MVKRLLMIAAGLVVAVVSMAKAADVEKARLATHQLKEPYWQCLSEETVKVLSRKMSGPDFVVYIKGRCPDQKKQFRIALIDYFAMKHPDIATSMHFTTADQVISAAIDDAASAYVDLNRSK